MMNSNRMKRTAYLPESPFIYAKDVVGGVEPGIWFLFDSIGNHITTQSSMDFFLINSTLVKESGENPQKVFSRWYIPNPTISYQDG